MNGRLFAKGAGKITTLTVGFLFLFILVFPLVPQTNGDSGEDIPFYDDIPFAENLLFFEELFIFDDAFSFAETLMGEEITLDEEVLLSEEISLEPQDDGEGTPAADEVLLGEDTSLVDETLLSEEDLYDNDDFLDDDTLFFEAPPLIFEVPMFEMRSLAEIFPDISWRQRILARSSEGLRNYFLSNESPSLVANPDLEIDLLGSVMEKNPSHLIEALVVVPYNEREFDLLDIYNALGRIEKIKDQSVILNGNDFYVFTDSTRIESSRNRRVVSDPPPSVTLPFSETMFLRLREVNFGNLFIRGEISISLYGITYSMTNFTDVRYLLIPVMRAERYITVIYLEPVREGMLIYSVTGFYLPGFIADRVNLTPNINRRIEIFMNWIIEGLREQEFRALEQEETGNYQY
ncbi:MAG: hypothetical protein FWG99_03365 [Treponema sp.]|nr:hypothetical protein [Treponema sp.]